MLGDNDFPLCFRHMLFASLHEADAAGALLPSIVRCRMRRPLPSKTPAKGITWYWPSVLNVNGAVKLQMGKSFHCYHLIIDQQAMKTATLQISQMQQFDITIFT